MPRRKNGEGWIRKRRAPVATRWRQRPQPGDSSSSRKRQLDVETVAVSSDQVRGWCVADEAAVDAFQGWAASKKSRECGLGRGGRGDWRRPPVVSIAPPLDRAVLRPGHVLEIAGPSGSGKTELLIQAAVSCVLPASFNGVSYGGSEAVVLMFDLDGRFDVARLTSVLKARINEAHSGDAAVTTSSGLEEQGDEVLRASLRRFYCLRCFKSFEFLAALRSLHIQSSRISQEHHGKAVQLVLIDGIGSFYWLDWMSSCAAAYTSRRTLGVQRFSELIVQELRNLRNTKLFLVLATKALLYAPPKKKAISSRIQYREYMPAAWQRFVTHRILLQPPPGTSGARVFTAQWDKPSLAEKDEFFIQDHGVQVVTKNAEEQL